MIRRGLIFNDYDTAAYGFTMTKLTLDTPPIVEEFVEIDGMHGSLDYCDANGAPIYKTRSLTAVFELSEGTFERREKIITEFIRTVHGKKCSIVHPDHGGKLLSGRVQINKDYSNLAHAQLTVQAVCQPWFCEPNEAYLELPVLDRSHNRLTKDNTVYLEELSTCNGGVIGDTEAITCTLVSNEAALHTYAVFRVQLEANETYYISARQISRGYWRASGKAVMPESFSPIVETGEDGYLYIWIVRLQSYSVVNLMDVVIVPSCEAAVLRNGSFDVPIDPGNPPVSGLILSVNGQSKRHYNNTTPQFVAPAGDVPVITFRVDTTDEVLYEVLRWQRRWLE